MQHNNPAAPELSVRCKSHLRPVSGNVSPQRAAWLRPPQKKRRKHEYSGGVIIVLWHFTFSKYLYRRSSSLA